MLILVSTRHHAAKLLCRIPQSELLRLLHLSLSEDWGEFAKDSEKDGNGH